MYQQKYKKHNNWAKDINRNFTKENTLTVITNTKTNSTLVINKIKLHTIHFTAKVKKTNDMKCWQ